MEIKIRELSERLDAVSTQHSENGDLIVIGTPKLDGHMALPSVSEVHVLDPITSENKLLIVVHLFQDIAYWEYESSNLFVEKNDITDFNLWRFLTSETMQNELRQYDYIAGVGLESNSGASTGSLSRQRAAYLCTGIDNLLSSLSATQALGLDIGTYTGSRLENDQNKDATLRPVVLIGIDVLTDDVDYSEFVQELLAEIRIAGLDFGLFENLKDDKMAKWITPPDCEPSYSFLANTSVQ